MKTVENDPHSLKYCTGLALVHLLAVVVGLSTCLAHTDVVTDHDVPSQGPRYSKVVSARSRKPFALPAARRVVLQLA